MNVLSVSDKIVPSIYSSRIRKKFEHIDLVIACGDLPYYYQEFIISMLNVPLLFVRGNHDPEVEYGEGGQRQCPLGGVDLHRRIIRLESVLLAGIEGSIRYKNEGIFQYTQDEMWMHVVKLVPGLLLNHFRYGRYLDIFVTHAPPWGIHDKLDLPHQGIKAFRWLIEVFKPKYHFHGHIHVYRPDAITVTQFGSTSVINTYGYCDTRLELDG
ncbi:MAG: metallophosphoesterase [Chloroflexi bacterium]|nr:metallophosphoesterase [Chloroflexota bacterium]MBU1661254.1 metallophosphoesterase [Chloroflexota bacterium]